MQIHTHTHTHTHTYVHRPPKEQSSHLPEVECVVCYTASKREGKEEGEGEGRGGEKEEWEKKGGRERHSNRIGNVILCPQCCGRHPSVSAVHRPPHLLLTDDDAPIHHYVIK